MRLAFYSDTHGKHKELTYPPADGVVFCGDLSSRGTLQELEEFIEFVKNLDYQYKIVIAGNHDFGLEGERRFELEKKLSVAGVYYLNDSGIELCGLKFWGSPIQPEFNDWAFNRGPGEEIEKHWRLIPEDTDILITHGPPLGVLDTLYNGRPAGCPSLLKRVEEVDPLVHAFGHIHEAYGRERRGKTLFLNASNLDIKYRPANPCHVIETASLQS